MVAIVRELPKCTSETVYSRIVLQGHTLKPVKTPFFSCAMGIIALGAHLGASDEAKCFICLSTCSSLLIISCSALEAVL